MVITLREKNIYVYNDKVKHLKINLEEQIKNQT